MRNNFEELEKSLSGKVKLDPKQAYRDLRRQHNAISFMGDIVQLFIGDLLKVVANYFGAKGNVQRVKHPLGMEDQSLNNSKYPNTREFE